MDLSLVGLVVALISGLFVKGSCVYLRLSCRGKE